MNIANVLTASRMCAGLWLIVGMPWITSAYVRMGILAVAAATDFLDGWCARTFKYESLLGRLFDPMADAFFVVGALLYLIRQGVVPYEVLVLSAVRYAACLVYYADIQAKRTKEVYKPVVCAKWFVFFKMLWLLLLILGSLNIVLMPILVHWAIGLIVVGLFFGSWLAYYVRYRRVLYG